MLEDSLVESSGRVRTRSKWYAIASFTFEAIALAILILIPYIYPAAQGQRTARSSGSS